MDDTSPEKDERLPLKFTSQMKRFVCIEYPGYIQDVSKALKTLGGEEQVNATLNDPLRRVGMHFRPNDPYCRQNFGDRFPVTDLLMKVKRKKKKKDGTENFHYECEVLGVIDTVVKFKGLADFQYVVPQIPDLLDGLRGSEILDIETPLHLPPPAFCRVDHPFDYHYRTDIVSKDRNLQPNEERLGKTFRKPRPSFIISCHFKTPVVPSQPNEAVLEEIKRFHDDGLDIIQRLFNIRPIWSKRAIIYHLGEKVKRERVRLLLPSVAYYWIGGPWRTFWTKFGYDPRKNPAAKIYQKLDFRLRTNKALRGMKLPPTVRHASEFLSTMRFQRSVPQPIIPLGVTNTTSIENPGTSSQKPDTGSQDSVTEESFMDMSVDKTDEQEILPYAFYPDRPPTARQMIYQLCDIRCAEVQKLISENDGRERVCTEYEGWLEQGTSEKIRPMLTRSLVELQRSKKGTSETVGGLCETDAQADDIEEDEASFLDTLMDDDDVEAYDILDEDF